MSKKSAAVAVMEGKGMDALDLSKIQVGNPEVIRLLEDTLAAAKRGEVVSVAVIASPRNGTFGASVAGGLMCEMLTGMEALKAKIVAHLNGGNARSTPILRMQG